MNGERFHHREADTVRLRTVIAEIDRELSLLPTPEDDGVAATRPLRRSWAELVELLALGPAPETRLCPTCGQVGMRAAASWPKTCHVHGDMTVFTTSASVTSE